MAKNPIDRRGRAARRLALLAPVVLGVLASSTAWAGLGETADSIARDHLALRGTTLAVTPAVDYDIHETTTADGARIRQYVSREGTVFAVAWSGRGQPDLKVVLAGQYDKYLAAATAHRGNHHVFTVSTPQLVISIVRAPRGFQGAAHLPALVPAGVSASELR
jgi:hypothetical protein